MEMSLRRKTSNSYGVMAAMAGLHQGLWVEKLATSLQSQRAHRLYNYATTKWYCWDLTFPGEVQHQSGWLMALKIATRSSEMFLLIKLHHMPSKLQTKEMMLICNPQPGIPLGSGPTPNFAKLMQPRGSPNICWRPGSSGGGGHKAKTLKQARAKKVKGSHCWFLVRETQDNVVSGMLCKLRSANFCSCLELGVLGNGN